MSIYWCPTSNDFEHPTLSGFDVCCAYPERHIHEEALKAMVFTVANRAANPIQTRRRTWVRWTGKTKRDWREARWYEMDFPMPNPGSSSARWIRYHIGLGLACGYPLVDILVFAWRNRQPEANE